jgi:hypothetical protein
MRPFLSVRLPGLRRAALQAASRSSHAGCVSRWTTSTTRSLKKIYASFAAGAKGGMPAGKDDEDDVPDLVDTNFEAVSEGEKKQ